MKLKSPVVTLIIGLLIAVATWVLSVVAQDDATTPAPTPTDQYGAATIGAER